MNLAYVSLAALVVAILVSCFTELNVGILALALSRLQSLSPNLRRVGLSATIADPDAYRAWLALDGDIDAVRLVQGEAGAHRADALPSLAAPARWCPASPRASASAPVRSR